MFSLLLAGVTSAAALESFISGVAATITVYSICKTGKGAKNPMKLKL